MKKIKVQSKISLPIFIILCIAAITLISFVVYILFFADFVSSKTRGDGAELIFVMFALFPLFLKSTFSKEIYLSEINAYENYLELIYKKQGRIKHIEKLNFSEILSFKLSANIDLQKIGKGTVCTSNSTTTIKLKDKEDIIFNQDSSTKLFGCPYQYILDILQIQKRLPSFTFNLQGNNEFAKADIDYFQRFHKRMPFKLPLQISMQKTPLLVKTLLGICITLMVFSIGISIYISLPSMPLNNAEKEYMVHYNLASRLRIDEKDYKKAIEELKKAEALVSNNPEVYQELAYNYKKLKNYQKAIDYAKIGLKYVNNTNSPYRKYHNFKFIRKCDISLYSVIAECERKLNNYNKAIEAYTYIIEKSHYTYDDSYFWRGYCYYYNNQYNLAHEDFLKHREIIMKYFQDQRETEYKDVYPRFNNDDLDNIDKWIQATK